MMYKYIYYNIYIYRIKPVHMPYQHNIFIQYIYIYMPYLFIHFLVNFRLVSPALPPACHDRGKHVPAVPPYIHIVAGLLH